MEVVEPKAKNEETVSFSGALTIRNADTFFCVKRTPLLA